jgi:hypothetical protein
LGCIKIVRLRVLQWPRNNIGGADEINVGAAIDLFNARAHASAKA